MEITLACKKCKHVFRKDLSDFDPETDEYCPYCDNHYVIDAITPETKKLAAEVKEAEPISADRDPRVKHIH